MGKNESQCNTCFWCSIAGWCAKGAHPVMHHELVSNCPEYTVRTYDYDEQTTSGLIEE